MTRGCKVHSTILAAILLVCAPSGLSAQTSAQWQADLQSLVSQLQSTHPDLFFHVSQQDFDAAVSNLNQTIPQLTTDQVTVALMQLVALLGDAHTALYPPYPILPLYFRWFSDGLYVYATVPDYSRALGAKVVGIGDMPVDQAYSAVSTVISHENDQWVRQRSATDLTVPQVLAYLGVTSGPAPVTYTLQDLSGAQFQIQVSLVSENFVQAPDSDSGFVPLWRQNTSSDYWYRYLPTTQTLYLAYNSCTEMPGLSFADFLNQALAFIAQNPVSRIVVDLRNNGGGSSNVFQPMLDTLAANAELRAKVTAIIGQGTFSSGVMAAAGLAGELGVPLIGGPTGGAVTSFGNVTDLYLINSGLVVYCGTKYFPGYYGFAGNALLPNWFVPVSSADYFARHDPYLRAAMIWPEQYQPPQSVSGSPAVVNAASFGAPVSPGGLATVFGDFPGVSPTLAASMPLTTQLAGVQVTVNGVASPLMGVWPGQINFQIPGGTAVGTAQVAITVPDQPVVTGMVPVVASAPGIFLTDFFDTNRPGAVLTFDNQVTSTTVRAARNDVIQIFATGAGPLTQTVVDGLPAPVSPLAETIASPRVFIGDEEATVEFSGLAPGYIGLWQINARVPDVPTITGQVPLVVVAPGGYASNAVTFWVE
jgi:uncharacterized protein (TIGR03437 family)